jgi:Flp pilus assembly protein TadG
VVEAIQASNDTHLMRSHSGNGPRRARLGTRVGLGAGGRGDEHGQGLVEFALLMPILITLIMGIIEFSLAFNAELSLNYATRDASLVAAEAGNDVGADCIILAQVERDLTAPASATRVTKVEIFWANPDGTVNGTNVDSYTRTGSTTCTFADGSQATVPYTATSTGYPTSSRCNILAGCGGSHIGLDNIGVRITYTHPLSTPAGRFFGPNPSITLVTANSMRMEPVL